MITKRVIVAVILSSPELEEALKFSLRNGREDLSDDTYKYIRTCVDMAKRDRLRSLMQK